LLERCHCIPHIVGSGLDVVRCGCAHIGVSQNALDHHVRHPKPIQIASEPAAREVMDSGEKRSSMVFVRLGLGGNRGKNTPQAAAERLRTADKTAHRHMGVSPY
jgi:hypothetical protein